MHFLQLTHIWNVYYIIAFVSSLVACPYLHILYSLVFRFYNEQLKVEEDVQHSFQERDGVLMLLAPFCQKELLPFTWDFESAENIYTPASYCP